MQRRAFLTATGTALGVLVAGCVSDTGPAGDGDPTGTPVPTDDPTDRREPTAESTPSRTPPSKRSATPTSTPPEGVVVENVTVRKAVAYESTMGSGGVLAGPDRQYVVATVRAAGALAADAFAFVTDDDSWAPGLPDTRGALNWAVAGHEGGAVGERGPGGDRSFLAFTVPSPLSASNPRIRLSRDGGAAAGASTAAESTDDGRTWPLSADARERLAASAPRFELLAFDAPSRVSHGEPLSVSLRCRNVSETDGRFLAAVYWPTDRIADDDESHLVERTVAAGETTAASLDLDTEYTASEPGPVALSVDGHVSARREVELRGVPTDR
jgi:hypothetical protein